MSGVRTRLFAETPTGGASSFCTPPHFATASRGGYEGGAAGDGTDATSGVIERALAAMMQHQMLTRQELAQAASTMEGFGRQGRGMDASDGGAQGVAMQQAVLDRLHP